MPLLYLVRHGETDWNREKRWQGHHDRSLSAAGRAQAAAAARRLRGERITQLHTSDLKRARETAQIIAGVCGVESGADRALREVDVGTGPASRMTRRRGAFPRGMPAGGRVVPAGKAARATSRWANGYAPT